MINLKTLKSWAVRLRGHHVVLDDERQDLLGIVEGLINECSYLENLIADLRDDVNKLKFE